MHIRKVLSAAGVLGLLLPAASTRAERLSCITKNGPHYVDEGNDPVILRGCNVGNWFILEMWMQALNDGSIPDQHSLEALLTSRFGEAEKDRLMEVWRANFITERDFDLIKTFGFNVIRLPFWYTLLEDDDNPFVLKDGAFDWMDQAIEWAGERGIHVILDLHGAQGSQGWEHHTGWQGRNELWSSQENQDRVVWLWQQIASRYKDNSTVAAYDILNEPWGANETQLRDVSVRIATAIRDVDPWHIVFLPGLTSGLWFYAEPESAYGLRNIAFTHHFYPGLFGGTPNIETHQYFFDNQMPEYIGYQNSFNSPFLVGEMNVVETSAGGGEMMRHHYDFNAAQGWATTTWSWKVFTAQGGLQSGNWGMVTNPTNGAMVLANTWQCDNWNGTFANACQASTTYTAPSGGETVYIVLKAGACCGGNLDISFDSVSLTDQSTGTDVIVNGSFDGSSGWQFFPITGSVTTDFASPLIPAGGSGTALRMTGNAECNAGVYQTLSLEPGHVYTLGGVSRDIASSASAAWCEVYIGTGVPTPGVDYLASAQIGNFNYHSATSAEIESYWRSFSTMNLAINTNNRDWLADRDRDPALLNHFPPAWHVPQSTDPAPANWRAFDIGGAFRGGERVLADDAISIYAAGDDVWGASDQFRFVYQPVDETFSITARITSLRDIDDYTKGGLMVRAGLDANAPHLSIQALPDGSMESNWRSNRGGDTSSDVATGLAFPDVWLRIEGDDSGSVQSFYSSDGSTWTPFTTLSFSDAIAGLNAGLFALSHDNAQFTRADFDRIALAGSQTDVPLEEQQGWKHWFHEGPVVADIDVAEPDNASGAGNALRISTPTGSGGGVYLPLELIGGQTYDVSGTIRLVGTGGGTATSRVRVSEETPTDSHPSMGAIIADVQATADAEVIGTIADFSAVNARFVAEGTGIVTYYLLLESSNTGNQGAYCVFDEVRVMLTTSVTSTSWMIN